VQAALGGTVATTLLEADRQFNVTVRLEPQYRDVIDAVRHIKVGSQTPSGVNAYVPLSELATISLDTGASYIYHERNETLYSDQIQRAWPRSWRHGGRGAAAHRRGREAMFRAAEQRMRPMLMTALSACIGLLPPAVSTGIGSQVQRPLVWPAPQRAG
jgi:Cu/Ag efflux pump CusA